MFAATQGISVSSLITRSAEILTSPGTLDHTMKASIPSVSVKTSSGEFNLPSTERTKVLQLLNGYNLNAFSLLDSVETLLETIWLQEGGAKTLAARSRIEPTPFRVCQFYSR